MNKGLMIEILYNACGPTMIPTTNGLANGLRRKGFCVVDPQPWVCGWSIALMNGGLRIEIPCNTFAPILRLTLYGLAKKTWDSFFVNLPSRNLVAYLCKFSLSNKML